MNPHFTIITPTIQRISLLETCYSVNNQTCKDWEHIVVMDSIPTKVNKTLTDSIKHPQRLILQCTEVHNNFGNTCRHNAWLLARGKYVYYLDDDNFLADDKVLQDLMEVKDNWGLFPILRHGRHFYNDPPSSCHVDTGNVLVKKEIGQWPNIPIYEADGQFIEGLKQYSYQAFPNFRPIMVMNASNRGI